MSAILTTGQRLEQADREGEELKLAYLDAVGRLMDAPEVDPSFDERWRLLSDRLRALRTGLRREDFDKDQLADLSDTFFEIRDLTDGAPLSEGPDHMVLDRLLVLIERIRQVLRDALDEHVRGVEGDTGVVVGELSRWLHGVPKTSIAELVGVDRRTLSRWVDSAEIPNVRLQTVARVVAILKHNWTPPGILAWFKRPRRDLDGRSPLSLLNERHFDDESLVMAARAGRSQYSS